MLCKIRLLEGNFRVIMEEIPVEYNIIIEALNCVVQNQQQALEQGDGEAAFECVVNTSEHVVQPSQQSDEAQQQAVFQCVVDSSDGQQVGYEVTGSIAFYPDSIFATSRKKAVQLVLACLNEYIS